MSNVESFRTSTSVSEVHEPNTYDTNEVDKDIELIVLSGIRP